MAAGYRDPLQSRAMSVVPLSSRDRGSTAAAPAGDVAAGTGRLEFTRVGARTVLTRAFASSPLKVLHPSQVNRSASVSLATYGGGLVGGDHIDLSIAVGPAATAVVGTQASTKVYRSPLGASQQVYAEVAADAILALLPDPVVCFAGATYRQEQRIRLDRGANLVLVDRLTAGRIEYGERWRFDEYVSRIFVWHTDRLVLHDALRLTRHEHDVARRLGRFNCVGVVVLMGPVLREIAARLVSESDAMRVERRSHFLFSAAPLGDEGALVRMASQSVEALDVALRSHLEMLTTLVGNPWMGK
jgi:urease accessory protein